MFACRQRPLKPSNRRGLSSHAFSNLCLSKPCIVSCLQQYIEQDSFVALDAFDLFAYTAPLKQFHQDFIVGSHFLLPSYACAQFRFLAMVFSESS